MGHNVDRGDLAAFHGHVQLDFAAQTVADAFEGVSHRGHAGHQHRHDEDESKDLLHGKSPLSKYFSTEATHQVRIPRCLVYSITL